MGVGTYARCSWRELPSAFCPAYKGDWGGGDNRDPAPLHHGPVLAVFLSGSGELVPLFTDLFTDLTDPVLLPGNLPGVSWSSHSVLFDTPVVLYVSNVRVPAPWPDVEGAP